MAYTFCKRVAIAETMCYEFGRFEFATRFEFVTHRQRDDQRRNDTTRTGCDLTVPKHTVRKTGTELKQEPDGTEVESASPNSLHLLVGHGLNLANHTMVSASNPSKCYKPYKPTISQPISQSHKPIALVSWNYFCIL